MRDLSAKPRHLGRTVLAILSLAAALLVYWPNFSAEFGLIDDHDIVSFLGPEQHLPLAKVPEVLMKTEVGGPGSSVRYRPSYWTLKLGESALWGPHPARWYAARVAIFAFAFFAGGVILGTYFNPFPAFVAAVFLMHHGFWGTIFSRLGPSEIYGTLGVSLFALGFWALWENKAYAWGMAALLVGALMAIGCKENFLILVPFVALLLWKKFRDRRARWPLVAVSIVITGFAAFIAVSVAYALKHHGTDIYAQSLSPLDRLKALAWGLFNGPNGLLLVPLAASLVLFFRSRERRGPMRTLLFFEFICAGLWFSQYFFYNAAWPNGTRYDFPGVLALDGAYLGLIHFYFGRREALGRPQKLAAAAVLAVAAGGFLSQHNAASRNRDATRRFRAQYEGVLSRLATRPQAPLVIEVNNVLLEYEPVYSLQRYLFSSRVPNPVLVKVNQALPALSGQARELAQELEGISKNGDTRPRPPPSAQIPFNISGEPRFVPLGSLRPGQACFALTFSAAKTLPCDDLGTLE